MNGKAGTDRPFNRIDAQNSMPAAFPAFLGRFGTITQIQAAAFPTVLAGNDVVVVAPAASGKTESVMVPICERLIRRTEPTRPGTVAVLYVVPTRALANDIEIRISEPASALKLAVRVRTGDRPAPVDGPATDVLVTTPESFDSLLCRHPSAFLDLHAIIIDEAHLVDGTARGDQVRMLIRRVLSRKDARRPQMIAMSATVHDPAALGERMFGSEPAVIRDDRVRPMAFRIEQSVGAALTALRRERLTKIIIFCNTKRQVEETAAEIARKGPWPAERVMVHHASLTRREREEVERAFRFWEAGILVATSTMELGVDIGDVDAVILVGAPDSAASLHQRVGRGCRRSSGLKAVFVPIDELDREQFESLAAEAPGGPSGAVPYLPDLSVAVQQIFSLLFENRKGLRRRTLRLLLEVLADGPTVDIIVDHLRDEGFLEEGSGEVIRAAARLMDMGEKGRIHSNIADSGGVRVVDSATGRTVGMLSGTGSAGTSVTIGGRTWTVTDKAGKGVSVRASSGSASESAARFGRKGSEGAFSRYLPAVLKNRSR